MCAWLVPWIKWQNIIFPTLWTDASVETTDLPQYLQPLIEGLTKDLTLHGRDELAAAIYECRGNIAVVPPIWAKLT